LNRFSLNRAVLCFLAVLLVPLSQALAGPPRRIDPVIVTGKQADALLGAGPRNLRAYAYRSGNFTPVLYQVDERMEVTVYPSAVSMERILTYAFDSGVNTEDPDPSFDENDEFVFMASSAAEKAPDGSLPGGASLCEEMEISDPLNGETRYLYACIMERPAPALQESRVKVNDLDYEKGANIIDADGYRVEYPAVNPVNFTSFRVRGEDGELKRQVVDRFKLGIKVQVLRGVAGYPLTDSDYEHFVRGVRAGPVRVIKEYKSVLETWSHSQKRSYNHVYFYPYHIEYDMDVTAAANWGDYIHRSHLIMAIDLNDQGRNMKFYSEKNLRGQKVDGHTSTTELKMDYGPTEWSCVSGEQAGTIMVHMGLYRWTELYNDLYYSDNDNRGDPPEKVPGMIGKFGYYVRDLQKAGFDNFPVRFAIYGRPGNYEKGAEEEFVPLYQSPLKVKINSHRLRAVVPDGPELEDDRADRPRSIYAEDKKSFETTQFLAPSFIIDPNLLGIGPGVGYSNIDFLGTGTYFGAMAMWTDRGYATYDVTISELRFIEGVESFEISAGYGSFPAEPYYGMGNDSDKDDKVLYWWTETEAEVEFSKYFAHIYGADFKIGYRAIELDSGIQPRSGDGTPSIEEHFGEDDELEGRRWGPPVYGMDGGNHSGFEVSLYRDMRSAEKLPKFGNYQEIRADVVTSALGADYDYAKVTIDLRGYYHPDWLNPIPYLDENVNRRYSMAKKFFGMGKNRTIAGRFRLVRTFADETDWYGRDVLDVPFYELPYLGSSSTLKGYQSKRFRDNDAVMASLEYRWRWWRFHDVAVFYDTGMVMDDMLEQESWEQTWHHGYGFSFRIHVPPHIIITFEWAWSPEEAGLMHQMNMAF